MFEKVKKTPEQIANEKQAEIDKNKETPEAKVIREKADAEKAAAEKKTGESKTASKESQSETKKKPEDKQTEAEKLEAKAKKDEQLLSVSDDEASKLSDEDKARLGELKKEQGKSKVQKRIDQLTREKKEAEEARDVDHALLEELQKRIDVLENPPKKPDYFVTVEKDRIVKYIAEDAAKPLAERREMSKEELNEWALEDSIAATQWVTERTIRRSDDKKNDKANERVKKSVTELLNQQQPSIDKTIIAHPELNTEAQEKELAAQGKTPEEIFKILCDGNEKYRIVQEVILKNQHFVTLPNGPELAVAEMEKIMGKAPKKTGETREERDTRIGKEAIAEEEERQREIDEASGTGSSHNKVDKKKVEKSEFEIEQDKVIERSGLKKEKVTDRIAKRSKEGIR